MSVWPVQQQATTQSNSLTVLNDWLNAKKEFAVAQERERALRKQVVELYSDIDENVLTAGTENIKTGVGELKIARKIDYKLATMVADKEVKAPNEMVGSMLNDLTAKFENGKFVAERLVIWKPELSVTEYKKLSPEMKKVVDRIVVTKQASSDVSFDSEK